MKIRGISEKPVLQGDIGPVVNKTAGPSISIRQRAGVIPFSYAYDDETLRNLSERREPRQLLAREPRS